MEDKLSVFLELYVSLVIKANQRRAGRERQMSALISLLYATDVCCVVDIWGVCYSSVKSYASRMPMTHPPDDYQTNEI